MRPRKSFNKIVTGSTATSQAHTTLFIHKPPKYIQVYLVANAAWLSLPHTLMLRIFSFGVRAANSWAGCGFPDPPGGRGAPPGGGGGPAPESNKEQAYIGMQVGTVV